METIVFLLLYRKSFISALYYLIWSVVGWMYWAPDGVITQKYVWRWREFAEDNNFLCAMSRDRLSFNFFYLIWSEFAYWVASKKNSAGKRIPVP